MEWRKPIHWSAQTHLWLAVHCSVVWKITEGQKWQKQLQTKKLEFLCWICPELCVYFKQVLETHKMIYLLAKIANNHYYLVKLLTSRLIYVLFFSLSLFFLMEVFCRMPKRWATEKIKDLNKPPKRQSAFESRSTDRLWTVESFWHPQPPPHMSHRTHHPRHPTPWGDPFLSYLPGMWADQPPPWLTAQKLLAEP